MNDQFRLPIPRISSAVKLTAMSFFRGLRVFRLDESYVGKHRLPQLAVRQCPVMPVYDKCFRLSGALHQDGGLGFPVVRLDVTGKPVDCAPLMAGRPGIDAVIINALPGDLHWPDPASTLHPVNGGLGEVGAHQGQDMLGVCLVGVTVVTGSAWLIRVSQVSSRP